MEDLTEESSRHRRRRVEDDYLQTLIESVTIEQVRECLHNLSPGKRIGLRNRAEAFDALVSTGKSVGDITDELLSLEAQAPFRHCFITGIDNEPARTLVETFAGTIIKTDTTEFRVAYTVNYPDWESITVEHVVPVREWVKSPDGKTKTLSELSLRHPIVLRLYKRQEGPRALIASFPGFSQGGGVKLSERLSYEVVVTELLNSIAKTLGVAIQSFPLLRCLNLLAEGESRRVRIVDSAVHSGEAGLAFSSRDTANSVNDVVKKFLYPHLKAELGEKVDENTFHRAVAEAFRQSTYRSIVAFWEKEQVVTRIQFWSIGAEFLFIWQGAASTYGLIESIIAPLSNISRSLLNSNESNLWTWLVEQPEGKVLVLGNICAEHGVSKDAVQSILLNGVNAGLLEPVYRIRTDKLLHETPNAWTAALSSLSRIFTTENNEKIDGRNPHAIEVAFKRVVGGEIDNAK
jgi:hypothetical protein